MVIDIIQFLPHNGVSLTYSLSTKENPIYSLKRPVITGFTLLNILDDWLITRAVIGLLSLDGRSLAFCRLACTEVPLNLLIHRRTQLNVPNNLWLFHLVHIKEPPSHRGTLYPFFGLKGEIGFDMCTRVHYPVLNPTFTLCISSAESA